MKLLLDGTFPARIDMHSTLDVQLERWIAESVADQDLIEHAASYGHAGVVFMGKSATARRQVLRSCRRLGVVLLSTVATEPVSAMEALVTQLDAISREVRIDQVLVIHSREVEVRPLLEVLAVASQRAEDD